MKLVKSLAIVIGAVICFFVSGCEQEAGKKEGENVCTVTFDPAGGVPETIPPVKVAKGGTLGADFPSVSRAGYEFKSWNKGSTKYTAETVISESVTLKASWNKIGIKLNDIFNIFDSFAGEKYTPPSGFAGIVSGVTYGTITEKTYFSATTDANRKCNVYTPPNYDPDVTYPVLYLLHGIGGTHNEWTNDGGKPNEIISNLIKNGKAKPMIVVMPNVRAMVPDTPPAQSTQVHFDAFHNFINDLRDDLMPFIKENYPVSDRRDQVAVAGLSMGGLESLHIGIKMPETFGYVGAFSAAPTLETIIPAPEQTLTSEWKSITFFMLCCGLQDTTALVPTQTYNKNLTDNGVRTAYYENTGVHDFVFWNKALYYFAQCIF